MKNSQGIDEFWDLPSIPIKDMSLIYRVYDGSSLDKDFSVNNNTLLVHFCPSSKIKNN